jgi:hypothetical protein
LKDLHRSEVELAGEGGVAQKLLHTLHRIPHPDLDDFLRVVVSLYNMFKSVPFGNRREGVDVFQEKVVGRPRQTVFVLATGQ